VSYNGRQGWAYAEYLTARLSGRSLAVVERLADIPTVTYQAPVETVGSAVTAPAITGTLIARPATAQPVVITPPSTVGTYVINHPVAPVYLNGEVVEGVGLPEASTMAMRISITYRSWSNHRRGRCNYPESRHSSWRAACPLWARSGLMQCNYRSVVGAFEHRRRDI
jgi:hypothetical protein